MSALAVTSLAPLRVPDGVVVLRSPRPGDAAAWSKARLANREWLEPAFPAWGDDWAAEQSELAWVQRCWQLRTAAARGHAMPFVILLDGELVGELGIEAVDEQSNSGEASVWMVREHGSSMVMYAASLLMLEYAFAGPRPLDRLLSPVATSSRKGRAPGLSAVGLSIEGTVARQVGDRGFVDHDLWVAHNTPEARAANTKRLEAMGGGSSPATAAPRVAPAILARAAVRTARQAVRAQRDAATWWGQPVRRDGVTLRPPATRDAGARAWAGGVLAARRGESARWVVEYAGRAVGRVHASFDSGTGVAQLDAALDPGADADLVPLALGAALDRIAEQRPELRRLVRVPLDGGGAVVATEAQLTSLGLTLVATFPGSDEAPRRWPGEQLWAPA